MPPSGFSSSARALSRGSDSRGRLRRKLPGCVWFHFVGWQRDSNWNQWKNQCVLNGFYPNHKSRPWREGESPKSWPRSFNVLQNGISQTLFSLNICQFTDHLLTLTECDHLTPGIHLKHYFPSLFSTKGGQQCERQRNSSLWKRSWGYRPSGRACYKWWRWSGLGFHGSLLTTT